MAVLRELEEAARLVEAVDQQMMLRFPEGSLARRAWDRLKVNVQEWQEQQAIADPFDALMRARTLEHDFKNIVAMFAEAGFDFD